MRGNALEILHEETILGYLLDSLVEKVVSMIGSHIEIIECDITGESIPAQEGM